ncbi:CDP-diacylglycerol--glycerol-3-phosphate 3-phosphatidyltransferase [Methylobacterium crusticola]|uniref:CDP-diacylglycerol--glycerol-3-phosphate 3-phosphatidyltransferase n=1 Tax=Methylobacterium crusticola TaxID=1697972 RepID=A0ABQ4QUA4_9HYPH|nr:CDP-alcohol phosphatidyltransferase family protein [Methylobacterium crusticola]GJD48873.1 CDP-diacylglycerol--glycerol-3-phosphate 3-phosphatidyltransferase [Methylobacterium crusticola]
MNPRHMSLHRLIPPQLTLPTLITLARFALVPLVVAAIARGAWGLAFAGFALAGLSDALDGWIARRFAMTSRLGALLDPLADKALVVAVVAALALEGTLPLWFAGLLALRDGLVLAVIALARARGRRLVVRPLAIGKVNTAAQIAFLAILLGARALGAGTGTFAALAAPALAGLAVASAALQAVRAAREPGAEAP